MEHAFLFPLPVLLSVMSIPANATAQSVQARSWTAQDLVDIEITVTRA
jgi:hypothetical protein